MTLRSPSIIILLAGFLATAIATYLTHSAADTNAKQARDFSADALVRNIEQRVERVDLKLRALKGLFAIDRTVLDAEFDDFSKFLSQPAFVKALQFVRFVDGADLQDYESTHRALRARPFKVTQRTPDAQTEPAGPRRTHYVIEFIYPYKGNEQALGLDVGSNKSSVAAISRAVSTNSITSTESFYLVQNPDEKAFLAYLPIASHRLHDGTHKVAGAAAALISLPELSKEISSDAAYLSRVVLKESGNELFSNKQLDGDRLTVERELKVFDRQWIVYVSTPAPETPNNLAMLIFGLGSVMTLLAVGAFEQSRLQQERQLVTSLLDESERARTFRDAAYQSLFESSGTANLEIEVTTGRILHANSNLLDIIGEAEVKLSGSPVEELIAPASRRNMEAALERVRETGSSSEPIELMLDVDDDKPRWALVSIGKPVQNSGGGQTAAVVMQDISSAKDYQRSRDILVRELAHRVRNTMQLVGSLADQTALRSSSVAQYRDNLKSRLHALSSAQDALFDANWGSLRLDSLVKKVLEPFADSSSPGKLSVDVEPVLVSAQQAQMIALAIHELANNASKYGALSVPDGKVMVNIATADPLTGASEQRVLRVRWKETGCDLAAGKPDRKGFGTVMLEKLLARQFNGTTTSTWAKDGLEFKAELPIKRTDQEI